MIRVMIIFLLFASNSLAGSPQFLFVFGSPGAGDGQFNFPRRLAVDGAGNVFIADRNNNRIQKFTNDGTFVTTWGAERHRRR